MHWLLIDGWLLFLKFFFLSFFLCIYLLRKIFDFLCAFTASWLLMCFLFCSLEFWFYFVFCLPLFTGWRVSEKNQYKCNFVLSFKGSFERKWSITITVAWLYSFLNVFVPVAIYLLIYCNWKKVQKNSKYKKKI